MHALVINVSINMDKPFVVAFKLSVVSNVRIKSWRCSVASLTFYLQLQISTGIKYPLFNDASHLEYFLVAIAIRIIIFLLIFCLSCQVWIKFDFLRVVLIKSNVVKV